MTSYVVLRAVGEGQFTIVSEVIAPTATVACRSVAESMSDAELDGGIDLRAVPARNWKVGAHHFDVRHERRLFTP